LNRRRLSPERLFLSPLPFFLASAFAQSPPPGAPEEATLPEVRVKSSAEKETATGPVLGYKAKNAATATKTDTPLRPTRRSPRPRNR
jgi:hypothetical protein